MEFMSVFQSIWTVVVFVLFVGIALWAWSSKNKTHFDKASRIPLEDEEYKDTDTTKTAEQRENNNG